MSTVTMKNQCRQRHSEVKDRATVAVAAPAVALATWVVAHVVLGVELAVKSGSSQATVGVVGITLTALLAACAGWALMGLVEKRRGRSRRPWTIIAVTVLVLSLLGPLGAASVAAGVSLLCLHLVVGLTIILGLGHTAC